MSERCAVFIDRDGVINTSRIVDGKPYAPQSLEEFRILPDVLEAIKLLKNEGFLTIVVTNQPDVGNGLVNKNIIVAMHERLMTALPIDAIKVCFHKKMDGCECRKPKPGMLYEASRDLSVDLKSSFMVGDRWSDILAGETAGCKTIFIDNSYNDNEKPLNSDWTTSSLYDAANVILSNSRK